MRDFFGGDLHFNNVVFFAPLIAPHSYKDIKTGTFATLSGDAHHLGGGGPFGRVINGQPGQLKFDGTGDRASWSVPALGTDDFTIEFWVNPFTGGHGAAYGRLVQIGPDASNGVFAIIRNNDPDPLSIYAVTYAGGWYSATNATAITMASYRWTHVAVCRRGTTYKIFIAGRLAATKTGATGSDLTGTTLYVGNNAALTEGFNGAFAQLRITKGVARYDQEFVLPALNGTFERLPDPSTGYAFSERAAAFPTHGVPSIPRRGRIPLALPEARRPPLVPRRTKFGGDPHYGNVVLHAPFNRGNSKDVRYGKTPTLVGIAGVNNFPLGGNGEEGYLYCLNAADYAYFSSLSALGTDDFTLESWILPSNGTAWDRVLELGASTTQGTLTFNLEQSTGPFTIQIFLYNSGSWQWVGSTSATSVPNSAWSHIALSRRNGVFHTFFNGKRTTQYAAMASVSLTGTTLYVSGSSLGSLNTANCRFNDLRLTKGVARYLDGHGFPPLVSELHTTSLTPGVRIAFPTHGVVKLDRRVPTYMKAESRRPPLLANPVVAGGDKYFNNVVLHLPLDDGAYGATTFKDGSRFNHSVSNTAVQQLFQAYAPLGRGAGYFDPTNTSRLILSDHAAWDIDGNYTIEFRFLTRAASGASYTKGIIGTGTFGSTAGWAVGHYQGDLRLRVNSTSYSGVATINTDTWYSVALVWRGAKFEVYVDGKLATSGTAETVTTSSSLIIGNVSPVDSNRYFQGYIDEIRLTKGVARYAAPYTPAAAPFPTHGVASAYGIE